MDRIRNAPYKLQVRGYSRPMTDESRRHVVMKRGWMAGGLLLGIGLLLPVGTPSVDAQTIRHVSVSDPTCGGQTPCDTAIQAIMLA